MTIGAVSHNLYMYANAATTAENHADFSELPAQGSEPTVVQTGAATQGATRQNVPARVGNDTAAGLLALQETEAEAADAHGVTSTTVTVQFQGRETTMKVYSNIKATRFIDLPDDRFNEVISDMQRSLEADYMKLENMTQPDPSYLANHPAMKPYATVEVDGKVVATLDNQGLIQASNALFQKFAAIVPNDVNGTNGPRLAQARAEHIAAALGGKVVRSSSAITQAQFEANPIDQEKLRPQINREAMMRDPMYQQIQDLKAQRAALAHG